MRIFLSRPLLQFLQSKGYTHMHLRGIEKKPESIVHSKDLPRDSYILIPRKEEVLQFEERKMHLEKIDSTALTDMLYADDIIQFWVDLPDAIASGYRHA